MIRNRKKILFLVLGLIAGILIFSGHLLYHPPLLPGRGINPAGAVYDFLAYSYYFTQAEWLKESGKYRAARRAAAWAGWHRPSRIRDLFGLVPDNFSDLGRKYAALGLNTAADRLFRAALIAPGLGEEEALEIISYLAILQDWPAVTRGAESLLVSSPDSSEGKYWLNRARLKARETSTAEKKEMTLTPTVAVRRNYHNMVLIQGYDLTRPDAEIPEDLSLVIYLQGWRPVPLTFRVIARLVSLDFPTVVETSSDLFTIAGGETVKPVLLWRNSSALYPGNYRLEVALTEAGPGGTEGALPDQDDYIPLAEMEIPPRWFPSSPRYELIKRHFGAGAYPVKKRTLLGPGSELVLEIDGSEPVTAIGMVSSARCFASFSQGRELARLTVRTGEGREYEFPISMGVDTAKCWWEASAPRKRGHRLAPLFRSWRVGPEAGKFSAHEYRAIFSLPCPAVVTSLTLNNIDQRAGLDIAEIILIPESP